MTDLGPEYDVLRKEYEVQLGQFLSNLESDRAGVSAGNLAAIERVRRIGHRISGTAAMFGYAEATRAGRDLETSKSADVAGCLASLCTVLRTILKHATGTAAVVQTRGPSVAESSWGISVFTRSRQRDELVACAIAIDTLLATTVGDAPPGQTSVEALRRIGRSLRLTGTAHGLGRVVERAVDVEHAEPERIKIAAQALLAVIRNESLPKDELDSDPILIVDDDPSLVSLLRHKLGDFGRPIIAASTLDEAQSLLSTSKIVLVVLDLLLPDADGRELFIRLQDSLQSALVPVIVLSALGDEATQTECLALGAEAYFTKPLEGSSYAAFRAAVGRALERSERAQAEARQDRLTALPNRWAFAEGFGRQMSLMVRRGSPLSIGVLDLDLFKAVNDEHGHTAGDEVLRRAMATIRRELRGSDLLARWGGEEFVVLFPDTVPAGGKRGLEAALAALRREEIQLPDGATISVSFSAGVAEVRPGARLEEAVAEADRALYAAKGAGRNCVLTLDEVAAGVTPRSLQVLVAEDDPVTAAMITHRLEREGFGVLHAPDGEAAWSVLSGADPRSVSLLLTDVQMPRMDGFELLGRIRRNPLTARLPVILLTALGSENDVVRGFELGADDYIPKPFSTVEMVVRIRRILKGR